MKKLLISLIIIFNLILIPVFADSINVEYVLGLPIVDSNQKSNMANKTTRINNITGGSKKALDIATQFCFNRGNFDDPVNPHYNNDDDFESFWNYIDSFFAGNTDYQYYTLFSSVNSSIMTDYEKVDFYLVFHNNRLGIMPKNYNSSIDSSFRVFEIPIVNSVDYKYYKFTVYCGTQANYISVPTTNTITNSSNYITLQYSYKPNFNVGSYDYLSSYNSYNANNYIDNFEYSFVSNMLTINKYNSSADWSDSASLYDNLTGSFQVKKDKDYNTPDSQPVVPVPDFNINDYYGCDYKHIGDSKLYGLYSVNRFFPYFTDEFRYNIGYTDLYVSMQIEGTTEPMLTRYNIGKIYFDSSVDDSYYVELKLDSQQAKYMSDNNISNVLITCEHKNAMGEFVGANIFVFDISSDSNNLIASINETSQNWSDYDDYVVNVNVSYDVPWGGSSSSNTFDTGNTDSTVLDNIENLVDGILNVPNYIINFIKGIFQGLFGVIEIFKVVFSWLPAELVGIIFSGLMLSSIWLLIKAIRGG